MKKALFCLTVLLTFASFGLAESAEAFTVVQTGATVEINYTEPSENAVGPDGAITALTDLAFCTLYYNTGSGLVKAVDIPASSPTGGQPMTVSYTVPFPPGMEADVTFSLTATDTSGNESAHSASVGKRVDMLAPGVPK